jgi:uncharacterized protein YcbK (DUF882 family)
MWSRRALLSAAGWAGASGLARAAIRPPPSESRRLKLFNAHTRESFDGPYRNADGVITAAVTELSELLRDHHSGVAVSIDIGVIDFLWDVLNAVGASAATILSAYRTPETNAMLARTTFGVAEHSQHIYARAIDFTIGSSLGDAMTVARRMQRGGVGWYPRSHFIHVDTGPVRNWDLAETHLQDLLTNPADAERARLRGATLAGRSSPHAPRLVQTSQYAPHGVSSEVIRPSAYGSGGIKDSLVRPSQYAGSH